MNLRKNFFAVLDFNLSIEANQRTEITVPNIITIVKSYFHGYRREIDDRMSAISVTI